MKDISLMEQLHYQQEKSRKAYDAFFGALNLSRPDRYNLLAQESQPSDLGLLKDAGFTPQNLVDRLNNSEIKTLAYLATKDHTRLFFLSDIEVIARKYGLKFLNTSDFKGDQNLFVSDLKAFEQLLEPLKNSYRYHRIYLLSPDRVHKGNIIKKHKHPLMFSYIAGIDGIWGKGNEEIFYLISQQDSFLNVNRSYFFWPFVNKVRIVMVAIALLLLYMVSLILVDGLLPILTMLVFWALSVIITNIATDAIYYKLERKSPNWLIKICHYIVPY